MKYRQQAEICSVIAPAAHRKMIVEMPLELPDVVQGEGFRACAHPEVNKASWFSLHSRFTAELPEEPIYFDMHQHI